MEAAQFDGNEENHKKEVSAFVVNTSKNSYEGGTLILAMGAKNRLLGLPGEQEPFSLFSRFSKSLCSPLKASLLWIT